MANGGGDGRTEGRTDGRTDGRMEIPPCVLQDIGPLGPLPKKYCMSMRNFAPLSSMINSGEIAFPIDTNNASKFLVFLRERGYSKFYIKLGLVALKWANSFFPRAESLNEPFLDRIIASANRNIVSSKNQKAPLSKSMIASILNLKNNASQRFSHSSSEFLSFAL